MNMAIEELAERIRTLQPPGNQLREKKMFGALAFMLNGNMLVAALNDGSLLVRTGKEGMEDALRLPGTSIMDMNGRQMSGFIVVSGDVIEDESALGRWIDLARNFVVTLPAK
jgi:hypothetical protein